MSSKLKIKWLKLIILLIVVAIICAGLTYFFYYYFNYVYKVKHIQVYDMQLKVDNYVGINVDYKLLAFGTVRPGDSSKREVVLTADSPTKVQIILKGDLAKWVSVSENDFGFTGNKTIAFIAVAPENATFGNYTGKAILILREP